MTISEIWIPESLTVLFFILSLFRPYIRFLWPLDGLVWLPLIALAIMVGLFPAYGFRPECLPMLLFALVYNIVKFPLLASSMRSEHNDSFLDQSKISTALVLVMLGAAAVPMFVFSPRIDMKLKREAEPATLIKAGEYSLRVFGDVQADRPMIFLVPPEIGSSMSVELICSELENNGFTVITYSRKNYDFPFIDENGKKHFSSFRNMLGYFNILNKASVRATANEKGKRFESERQTDIEYLLSRLPFLLGVRNQNELPPVLLVGYGAGGSAIAYLSGNNDFIERFPNVIGAAAIESRLWSSYENRSRTVRALTSSRMAHRNWTKIVNWFYGKMPIQVSRTGALPGEGLPVLHLVSGNALDSGKKQRPYAAVFDSLRFGPGPVALVSFESAGILDYQDFPLTHPILSFLLPGLKDSEKNKIPVSDTANLIGNFASLLLENTEQTETEQEINIPPRNPISGRPYVESRDMPWFQL